MEMVNKIRCLTFMPSPFLSSQPLSLLECRRLLERFNEASTNVGGGLITVYFVGTALTTVRPVSAWTRTFDVAALIVVVGLAFFSILGGGKAFNSPGGFLQFSEPPVLRDTC